MQYLSSYIGDSAEFSIPLSWNGAAFSPGDDWTLIFTAKKNASDADSDAVIQKASGLGIAVTGYTAAVALVPEDTSELGAQTLVWDVQAQHISTGAIRTVALGRHNLSRDITREPQTSIPVKTTTDPAPYGPPMPDGLADITSIAITAGDELEIVKGGVTYWTPLYRR